MTKVKINTGGDSEEEIKRRTAKTKLATIKLTKISKDHGI